MLVPGLFGGQQDVSTGPCNSCTFSAHGAILSGGRANSEARLLLDGLSIAVPQAGGTNYLTDTRNCAGSELHDVGQHRRSGVGRPGDEHHPANRRQHPVGQRASRSWANDTLQGSNYTPELQAAGLAAPNPLIKFYDFSGAVGGPIKKDKIWFFAHRPLAGQLVLYLRSSTTRTRATRTPGCMCPTQPAGVQRQDLGQRQRCA